MKLKDKQKLFCEYYTESNNGTESAIRAGYSSSSAPQQASRMLKDVKIIQYIEFMRLTIEEVFKIQAKKSLETIIELRDDLRVADSVRLRACQDILDRAGYKTTDKIKLTANIEHNGAIAASKEMHILQEIINTNEELADAILRAMKERNQSINIPTVDKE